MSTHNIPLCYRKSKKYIIFMPSDLAPWLTLISSNYPCLEHIFMVRKVFEPLKFYCTIVFQWVWYWTNLTWHFGLHDPEKKSVSNSKWWSTKHPLLIFPMPSHPRHKFGIRLKTPVDVVINLLFSLFLISIHYGFFTETRNIHCTGYHYYYFIIISLLCPRKSFGWHIKIATSVCP